MLAPMAPHVTEEIWRALGHDTSVHLESWPKFDPKLARDEMVTSSCRSTARSATASKSPPARTEAAVRELALKSESVIRHLAGKTPTKFIFVKDKMLSIVA